MWCDGLLSLPGIQTAWVFFKPLCGKEVFLESSQFFFLSIHSAYLPSLKYCYILICLERRGFTCVYLFVNLGCGPVEADLVVFCLLDSSYLDNSCFFCRCIHRCSEENSFRDLWRFAEGHLSHRSDRTCCSSRAGCWQGLSWDDWQRRRWQCHAGWLHGKFAGRWLFQSSPLVWSYR